MLNFLDEDLDLILQNTIESWRGLKNKTIFITGGTGFFGMWLQSSFSHINRELNLDAKLILLTRNKTKFLDTYPHIKEHAEIQFLEGDICNFLFPEEPIDFIIHAATDASVKLNLEQPLSMYETVVDGTRRVLELARLKSVTSMLFTSSGAVYGKQPEELTHVPEEYVGGPVLSDASSVYGEGKRMAEVLCAVYHKHFEVPVKVARCYAFVGPFLPLDAHFAIGNFMKNVIHGENIIIEGDGTPYRSYMYAADLMIWLWTILFSGQNNMPYNVGSDEALSIKQLAEETARFNKDIDIVVKQPATGAKPLRYVPSIQRAQKHLGLKLFTDLRTSINKTLQFHRQSGKP